MRASRLLSLLLLLQNHGLMSATQLARELGVTVRTVYRDVDALAAAGVPIYAEHGPSGGYRLTDGYRTRLTGLTADEAESLFLTGMPQPAAELGLGAQLAAAELKLMAALPTAYRDASQRIRQRFHLDAPGWFREPEAVPHLLEAAEAVWQEKSIQLRYHRWAPTPGIVTRLVDPLGLVLKAGVWYLIAAQEGSVRTYRIGKILGLTSASASFTRPDGFDLAAFWRAHVERYEAAAHRITIDVELTPAGVRMLPDLVDSRTAQATLRSLAPASAADAAAPDGGWVPAVVPVESIEHAVPLVLRFGAELRVTGPAELIDRLRATIRAMTALYC